MISLMASRFRVEYTPEGKGYRVYNLRMVGDELKHIERTDDLTKEETKELISDLVYAVRGLLDNIKEMKNEQKVGKWVWSDGDCKCSLCHTSPLDYTDACGLDGGSTMDWTNPMQFCPNCGAKMEREEDGRT